MMKSSPLIWRYLVNVKSTVKILENMNFKYSELSNKREVYLILFEKNFPTPRFFYYPNEKKVPTSGLFQLHSYLGAQSKYVIFNLKSNLI